MRTLLATILLALVAVSVGAQSLAEASEAAKKVKHEWPASTSTGPATPASVTPAAAKTDDVKDAAGDKPDKPVVKDETYWRARMVPLTAQLTTDLAVVAPLQTRYAELHGKFATMDTVFQQQLVAPEMFRVQTELKAATDRVTADTGAIDDLREEGRKAGALPGWLR